MYSSSSQSGKRFNYDGSARVYCSTCGEFIGNTHFKFQRAICEMCRRVEAGEPVTEQAIRDYKSSKLGQSDVSLLLLPANEPKLKKFSLASLTGDLMVAVGLKKKEKPVDSTVSRQVSKSKRRGPILEKIDLGSMEELDKKAGEVR